MHRRMEDRIGRLCAEFVAEQNPERARELSGQLRTELHRFVEMLRARVTQYPILEERRVQSGIPRPALMAGETLPTMPVAEIRSDAKQSII
jgi:plasmid stabilization system protein ParE